MPTRKVLNRAMHARSPILLQPDPYGVDRIPRPEKPGALHGEVWLTVQTIQAQQLIHGRNGSPDKPTIIGLVGFANRLRVIWQAARSDDPYADWWLVKVHDAIEITRAAIDRRQAELDRQLEQMTAMEVRVAASTRPYRIHLKFANPYAYRGAQLLAQYDRLVCSALTARHIGLLDGDAQVHQAFARKLRALFMIPQSYRFLKIDRESVHRQSGRSLEARQAMGEVPQAILNGQHRAPLTPRSVTLASGYAGHVNLHAGSAISDTDPNKNDDG